MARANRFALAGLLAALMAGWAGGGQAQGFGPPAPQTHFASVAVDASILYARGSGAAADLLRDALEAELRQDFAGRIDGRGPRLVVRITALSLNDYVGSEGGRFGFGGGATNTDYLQGEALVLGPKGEVLARYPQLSAVPASSGGAWYLPDAEGRRVVALAKHFGGWLQRSIR
jgi:hypothetical protein